MENVRLKISIIVLSILLFTVNSCDNNEEFNDFKVSLEDQGARGKVLCEREASFPLVISEDLNIKPNLKSTRSNDAPLVYELGSGYAFNVIPLSSMRNILAPVININKYIEGESLRLEKLETPLNETKVDQNTFYTFDEYVRNKSYTNKIEMEASFSFIGIVTASAKSELNTVFKKNIDKKDETILGEFTAEYEGSIYSLLYQDKDAYSKIAFKYLDENFVKKIYNTSPQNVFDTFGSLTLFKFKTGGIARAFYSGQTKEVIDEKTTSVAFNNSMNASVSVAKLITAGVNFKFDSQNDFYSKDVNKFSYINIAVKTVGGNGGVAQYSPTVDIKNVNINLGSWAASLDNKKTHVLTDVPNKGLVPTSNLILEDNFKRNIEYLNNGQASKIINRYKLDEPYIYITTHEENISGSDEEGEADFHVKAFLITRHGNPIALYTTKGYIRKDIIFPYEPSRRRTGDYPSENELNNLITECRNYIKERYGLKVVYNPVNQAGPNWGASRIYSYENMDFNINYCGKYYNSDSKITYWLFNKDGKKYGFAIADNYILNTYAFKSIPSQTINNLDYRELSKYLIIGL